MKTSALLGAGGENDSSEVLWEDCGVMMLRSGQCRFGPHRNLRDGRFDQDRILEAFKQLASGNAKDRRRRQ